MHLSHITRAGALAGLMGPTFSFLLELSLDPVRERRRDACLPLALWMTANSPSSAGNKVVTAAAGKHFLNSQW